MEITKLNEIFSITDSTDVFEMVGSISSETSGTLNIHFSVNRISGEHLGDCSYNKYVIEGALNLTLNCLEENREEFSTYANSIITNVLNHFKTIN
jgi:hypothetical protein